MCYNYYTNFSYLGEERKSFVLVEVISTGHTLPDIIILLKIGTKMLIYLRADPSSLLISNISPLYIDPTSVFLAIFPFIQLK